MTQFEASLNMHLDTMEKYVGRFKKCKTLEELSHMALMASEQINIDAKTSKSISELLKIKEGA